MPGGFEKHMVLGTRQGYSSLLAPCWQRPLEVLAVAMRGRGLRPDAVSVDAGITAARSWRVALELMDTLGEPEMAGWDWEDQETSKEERKNLRK